MKYLLSILTLLLFLGCGESTESTSTAPTVVEMQLNKSYSVYRGDRVNKTSSDAQISITKSIQGDTTTVLLLLGSAQIVRAH